MISLEHSAPLGAFGLIFVRVCCFLSYEDILKLAATNRAFRTFIIQPSGGRENSDDSLNHLHTLLWSQLCSREVVFCEPGLEQSFYEHGSSIKDHYDRNCVSFYVVEFSAPGARQEFHICKDRADVRATLNEQFLADGNRLFIQHLCRLGLDILVYVCYRGRLLTVTPMYDCMTLRLGSSSYLRFKYLGGINSSPSQSASSLHSQASHEEVYLASNSRGERVWLSVPAAAKTVEPFELAPSCKPVHTFYRGGRNCRYQITHWTDEAAKKAAVDGQDAPTVGVECPPGLFCDILFLDIHPHFDVSILPDLHSSAAPAHTLDTPNMRNAQFKICVPIKLRAICSQSQTFDLIVPSEESRMKVIQNSIQHPNSHVSSSATYPEVAAAPEDDRHATILSSNASATSQPFDPDFIGNITRTDQASLSASSALPRDIHMIRNREFRAFTLRLGKNVVDPTSLAEAQDGPFVAPVILMY